MTQLQVCYQGSPVEFELIDGHVYANATAMCKPFGKSPYEWGRLPGTTRYVNTLRANRENPLTLTISRKGGIEGGGSTWIHEKLILKLAQWLDVDFEIWCDEQVARLLRWQQSIATPALPQSLPEALRALATEIEAKEALSQQLADAQPKLDHYQQVMDADGGYTVAEVAKMIGAGPNKLFAFLREAGVLYELRNHNVPIQTYVDNGWFRVKQSSYQHGDHRAAYPKLYVTSKGVEGIRHKWLNRPGLAPVPLTASVV